jgi:hypothetical protein
VNLVDEVAREIDLDLEVLGSVNREDPLDFRPRAQDTYESGVGQLDQTIVPALVWMT